MRKCALIAVTIALLFCVSCSDSSSSREYDELADRIQANASDTQAPTDPSSDIISLRVHTFGMQDHQQLMKIYQNKHPSISIEITDYFSPTNQQGIFERYVQQTSVALMAGSGPDVILADGLPLLSMAKSGLIHDISRYIEEDPTFNSDNYYMNVIDALRWNGGLYMLPIQFDYSALSINKNASEPVQNAFALLDRIDVFAAHDLYQIESEQRPTPESFYFEKANCSKAQGILTWGLDAFFDPMRGRAELQSEEFIDLLQRSKSLPYLDQTFFVSTYGISIDEIEARDALYRDAHTLLLKLQRLLEFPEDRFSKPAPIANTDGTISFYAYSYSIAETCQNKSDAWNLLHFLAQEEDEDYGVGYPLRLGGTLFAIPINRANYAAIISSSSFDFFMSDARRQGWDVDGVKDRIDTCVQQVDLWNQSVNRLAFNDKAFIDSVISANYVLFMDDEITAEEAAKRMQEKAVRYLDE